MNIYDIYSNIYHNCKVDGKTYKRKAKDIFSCFVIEENKNDRFFVNISEGLASKYEAYLEENIDNTLLYDLFTYAKNEGEEITFHLLDTGIYVYEDLKEINKEFSYLYQKNADEGNILLELKYANEWFYLDEYILVNKERKVVQESKQILSKIDIARAKKLLETRKDTSLIKIVYNKYIDGIGEDFITKQVSIHYKNGQIKFYDGEIFYDNYDRLIKKGYRKNGGVEHGKNYV